MLTTKQIYNALILNTYDALFAFEMTAWNIASGNRYQFEQLRRWIIEIKIVEGNFIIKNMYSS